MVGNTVFLHNCLVICALGSVCEMTVSASAHVTNEFEADLVPQSTAVMNATLNTNRLQNTAETEPAQHHVNPVTTHTTNSTISRQQNAGDRENTSRIRTKNGSMGITGFATCLEIPAVKEFTIEDSVGHLYAHSSNRDHKWECQFLVHVQSHQVVLFQINECSGPIELQYSEYYSIIIHNKVSITCMRFPDTIVQYYSMTDTAKVKVKMSGASHFRWFGMITDNRNSSVSLTFSAVNRSERLHTELQRVDSSPSAGYIQTLGLDGYTPTLKIMRSCVTLTRAPDHIIFLTPVRQQRMCPEYVSTYLGQCGSRQNCLENPKWHSFPLFLFPDDFGNGTSEELHLSLVFFVDYDNYDACQFRLRFSFHAENLKPQRVPELGTWNCSVSVWPDLFEHFPCDLRSQCAEHEDEAPCPYTSDKCGQGKIDAGGNCYIFNLDDQMNHVDAEEKCKESGTFLVSLETIQEIEAFSEVQKYNIHFDVWVGAAAATKSNRKTTSPDTMYTNVFLWKSGAVVFFLTVKLDPTWPTRDVRGCVLWKALAHTFSHRPCDFPEGFVCEFPPLSDQHYTSTPVTLPVPQSTTTSSVRLEICPMQYLTHQWLACDVKSQCRGLENTETWYRATCRISQELTQPYFYCDVSEEFVPYSVVCDFQQDCLDRLDEDFCKYPVCGQDMLNCGQGQCVDMEKKCNGLMDCVTNYDEAGCKAEKFLMYGTKPPAVINFDVPGEFTVTPLPGNNTQCPETHFQCHDDGFCLPVYVRCNNMFDCPGHEDEADCKNYKTCPGFYRCRDRHKTLCLHVNHMCDGLPQCPLLDDELLCNITCHESCVCRGYAFSCQSSFPVSSFPQLRYLEARRSGMRITDVTHNIMLIHLGVEECGWRRLQELVLPNLHSLDLSKNLLQSVNFSHFARLHQLRRLNLVGNPMSNNTFLVQNQYVLPSLVVFNISHVQAKSVNMSMLPVAMPKLQVLDLSWNEIKVLQEQGLFSNLRVFNLQGCPITDFAPDFMKNMTNLMHVFSDNFKLCCPVVLPDNFLGKCEAPSDEISSCNALLKSVVYRGALLIFAVLAVLGNLGGFVYRIYFLSKSTKTGFVIFVLHLCVSDFFMGVYLVFIGVADWIYAGTYIWNDVAWKQSSACSVAGFLSLLSSEVSAFLICFITIDRFLVLRFPFSQIRFGARSAHIACVIMWAVGFTLAIVPVLPVTSHWEFFHQTGICIPLPITRADFPGRIYSFSIMIVCNLILFLMIGVGQCLIYWSVRSKGLSNQLIKTKDMGAQSTQSKEATIARRLLSVAVSDFLCWFPIGLCGIMAASGVVIPGEVNVGMAIFVLPLNSALNPFLYTLSIILEKRRKAQELRFQKMLRAEQKR